MRSRSPLALVPLLLLAWACASPNPSGEAWRQQHPGFTAAPPGLGQSFGEVMASLDAPVEGRKVEVVELRVLSLDAAPWKAIAPEDAAAEKGLVGVVVGRRCHQREGLSTTTALRGSWLLFEGGTLRAFDQGVFGDACALTSGYQPAPARLAPVERGLARYVAERYPRAASDLEAEVRRALRLVDVGRLEEAREALAAVDRDIAEVRARLLRPEDYKDEELRGFRAQEQRLRAGRAELYHKLRRAEREAGAASATPRTQP